MLLFLIYTFTFFVVFFPIMFWCLYLLVCLKLVDYFLLDSKDLNLGIQPKRVSVINIKFFFFLDCLLTLWGTLKAIILAFHLPSLLVSSLCLLSFCFFKFCSPLYFWLINFPLSLFPDSLPFSQFCWSILKSGIYSDLSRFSFSLNAREFLWILVCVYKIFVEVQCAY